MLALAVLMVLQYQNCSTYADPNPFQAPDALDISSETTPTQIKLDSPNGVIDVAQSDLTLSVGGDCNVGLSTNHYIEARLSDSLNTPIPIKVRAEDNLCDQTQPSLPAHCYVARQFRCEHGKYYIHLPITCAAFRGQAQSLYRLVAQLVTVDQNGIETRDPKASFDRFLNIAWPATTVCP